MSELPDHTRKFIASLSEEDLKTLASLMVTWRTIQGWCRVNRWIALTVIGFLIVLAQGFDAIKGLLGLKH